MRHIGVFEIFQIIIVVIQGLIIGGVLICGIFYGGWFGPILIAIGPTILNLIIYLLLDIADNHYSKKNSEKND